MIIDAPDSPAAARRSSGPEPASFDTAMAHLYRGEMHRMVTWRQRLDITTNWAMIMALGMTTFALGSERTPPYILLLGLAAVAMCLVIEARRYQSLHDSLWRLRVLEQHHFGELLHATPAPDLSWRDRLAADLARPASRIGLVAAARFRLRRNYLMLSYFITTAWLTKVFIHPASPRTFDEFYSRLAVGDLMPSWFVTASAGTFIVVSTILAASSPSEEEVERQGKSSARLVSPSDARQ